MRTPLLGAAIAAIVLANALVFGALDTYLLTPTPRPPRVVQHKTFTPNPEYAKRRVTATPIPPPTATPRPTAFPLRDPRVPLGRPDEE
jgi:hypothetical protein